MSKTWKWIIIAAVILAIMLCATCSVIGVVSFLAIDRDSAAEATAIPENTPLANAPTATEEMEETEENGLSETPEESAPTSVPNQLTTEPENFDDYAPIMAEAWELANYYFVNQPLDGELLIEGAIRGLKETLPADHPMYTQYDEAAYTIASGADGESNPDFYAYTQPLEDIWYQAYDQANGLALDGNLLIQGAMRGMMVSLGDKHSMYLSPVELTQLTIDQEGEYEGIGAWVDTSGEYITIISPMAGSPAEAAGLKTGDIVIAIDGKDMTGVNPDIALQNVLGPAGSIVILTVEREGESELLDIEITRAKIVVPSIEYEMLENNIGYIQLFDFGEHASDDFIAALSDLQDQGAQGLILDLRGNGGGYLVTAVNILSQFIRSNTDIIYQVYGDGTEEVWKTNPAGIAYDIPLVVLSDGGSASASEITIGALQDLDRATVVGTLTYGKGSVHYVLPLENENGAVQVTIAKWLTPDRRFIHEIGIEPDIVIEFDEEAYEADETDNQLEKAIEVLLEKMR